MALGREEAEDRLGVTRTMLEHAGETGYVRRPRLRRNVKTRTLCQYRGDRRLHRGKRRTNAWHPPASAGDLLPAREDHSGGASCEFKGGPRPINKTAA